MQFMWTSTGKKLRAAWKSITVGFVIGIGSAFTSEYLGVIHVLSVLLGGTVAGWTAYAVNIWEERKG